MRHGLMLACALMAHTVALATPTHEAVRQVGEGRFVHAPRRGARVRIESLETRYSRSRFNGARRLEPPAAIVAFVDSSSH